MKAIINGKSMELEEGITLQQMLDILENKSKMIVIEQNRNIIAKENFTSTKIEEGDEIEIITFAGGG